ncbi:MAG: hypothetical protein P1U46_03385 [Patescibacteria group bacterium]|nr:hypothetical protein [Patescibacteria group bacterium]
MTLKEILNTSLKDKDYIHFIKKAYNLEYSQKELDKEEKRNILNELEELIFNNK